MSMPPTSTLYGLLVRGAVFSSAPLSCSLSLMRHRPPKTSRFAGLRPEFFQLRYIRDRANDRRERRSDSQFREWSVAGAWQYILDGHEAEGAQAIIDARHRQIECRRFYRAIEFCGLPWFKPLGNLPAIGWDNGEFRLGQVARHPAAGKFYRACERPRLLHQQFLSKNRLVKEIAQGGEVSGVGRRHPPERPPCRGGPRAMIRSCRGRIFPGSTPMAFLALENSHPHIAEGNLSALLGPSGCGKSSWFRALPWPIGAPRRVDGFLLRDGGADQWAAGKARHRLFQRDALGSTGFQSGKRRYVPPIRRLRQETYEPRPSIVTMGDFEGFHRCLSPL